MELEAIRNRESEAGSNLLRIICFLNMEEKEDERIFERN